MSLMPWDIDLILAKIVRYVGPKFVPNLRLVNSGWGCKALTEMGVAGAASVQIAPKNLDDFLGSGLVHHNLQLSLNFGATLSKAQFGHLVDGAPALAASGVITSLKFRGIDSGRCDNDYESDWFRLQQLLAQVSPTIRRLHVLDGDTNCNSVCTWARPWQGNLDESELVFPQLEELVWGFQEYTIPVFQALLKVRVMPKLKRLQIRAPNNERERAMYAVGFKLGLDNLATGGPARLTELELALDGACSGLLMDASFQLPTVRELTLHILRLAAGKGRGGGGNIALMGHFIAQIFPGLILLDLLYECNATSAHLDYFRFPFCIGRLPHLNALNYGIWGQLDNSGGPLKLQAFSSQLIQDNFPAIRSVSVDAGFQLTFMDGHPLQFLTVSRLTVRIGGAGLPSASMKPAAANLHEMYPHVNCLALDFGALGGGCELPAAACACAAAQLLLMEFGCLEELELLNCQAVHVVQIWEDVAARFASLRRLTLKRASQQEIGMAVKEAAQPLLSSLSLTTILTSCPQMLWIEADEELLAAISGGVALNAVYAEAYDLQRLHPHLKIRLN